MKQNHVLSEAELDRYEDFYRDFETPLMQEIRRQVYGEDIALHSWGTPQELRDDLARLHIGAESRIADLGCGPCGALMAILAAVGCCGTGVDRSASALRTGQARAACIGIADRMDVQCADLNETLPLANASFDAIQAVDTVPHLQDRQAFFQEVARLLRPGGRFLCIDPCILTGSISNVDLDCRLRWGYTQIAAPGWNETLIEQAGLRIIECQDRKEAASRNAEREASVYATYQAELEQHARWHDFRSHQLYVETAARLFREGVMSRLMLLAVKSGSD